MELSAADGGTSTSGLQIARNHMPLSIPAAPASVSLWVFAAAVVGGIWLWMAICRPGAGPVSASSRRIVVYAKSQNENMTADEIQHLLDEWGD